MKTEETDDEERKRLRRAYYHANREHMLAKQKDWNERHKEQRRAYQREYSHRPESIARARERYAAIMSDPDLHMRECEMERRRYARKKLEQTIKQNTK